MPKTQVATGAATDTPVQETMPTREVRLLAPHEHGGRNYQAGATLTLHAGDAEWLVAMGRAEFVTAN